MPKDNQKACLVSEDSNRKDQESEKAVVCSSVGSGNSPSESPLKRKHPPDVQDIECHSEVSLKKLILSFDAHFEIFAYFSCSIFVEQDVEGESGDGRKEAAPSRTGMGSKRSRSAEVHNLSERVS